MRASILLLIFLVTVNLSGRAGAYGPSTHMRETERYIELCRENPLPGPEHDPDLLQEGIWFFRLGSIWPDIARLLTYDNSGGAVLVDENLVDPHNRHFNRHLLNQALEIFPEDDWKIPFTTGCLLHNTGDLVAQDLLTQHMAVRSRTGELDILPGFYDDHAGGEVEGFVEGGLEIAHAESFLYRGMIFHFLIQPAGRADLLMVLEYYLEEYEQYFEVPLCPGPDEAFLGVEEILSGEPWSLLAPVARDAFNQLCGGYAARATFPGNGLIDWSEVTRMYNGPASSRRFWSLYRTEGYSDLSPMILLTFDDGQGYFDNFPNWSSKMMKSGAIQSLNAYLPDELEPEDGRFLSELEWLDDDTGGSIVSIDPFDPPSSVTLSLALYETPGRTPGADTVSLRVREDSESGTLAAWTAGSARMDPWDIEGVAPVVLAVSFDPGPYITNGAGGFFAEVGHGSNPEDRPWLTTDWSVYRRIDEIDMDKAAYTLQYSTYGHWPYSLEIAW